MSLAKTSKRILLPFVAIIVVLTSNTVYAISPQQRLLFDAGIGYSDPGNSVSSCVNSSFGGSVDRYLQVLSSQESGANPTAQNPNASASGKYQYIDRTWKGSATNYYPPALQYEHAYEAPEAVQDAVAYLEYTNKFRSEGGDVFRLAVSHYYPIALTEEWRLDEVPAASAGNTLTPREYAEYTIGHIGDEGYAADVKFYYTEAPDFATWLAEAGGSYEGTGAISNSCAAGVPAGDFVFFSQYDEKWRAYQYGTSTLAPSGCGPTSVAMVIATLIDSSVTPKDVADFGNSNNSYTPGVGSKHQEMLIDGPTNWGLSVETIGTDMSRAIENMRTGSLIIATGIGPTPFTTGGHIIVLRGVTDDGQILVGDPAHPDANKTEYSPQLLSGYIKGMFSVSKI